MPGAEWPDYPALKGRVNRLQANASRNWTSEVAKRFSVDDLARKPFINIEFDLYI